VRVLELGCGTGLFTRMAAESGAEIVAIDISPVLLEEARGKTQSLNVTYQEADAHALEFPSEYFDVVFGSSILHHLIVRECLREVHRVLVSGGRAVFAEPNMMNPQIWMERNISWVRRVSGTSPDETAFVRFNLARQLWAQGFVDVIVLPHEFLHPWTPEALIPAVERLSRALERTPLIREIGGSLLIKGTKK